MGVRIFIRFEFAADASPPLRGLRLPLRGARLAVLFVKLPEVGPKIVRERIPEREGVRAD